MKTKLLSLAFLMLFTITSSYGQSSFEQAGIAVQGIARDNNNTVLANQTISLTFELYYIDSSNYEKSISSPETLNIETDAFGVFSHIVDPGEVNNPKFANNQVYLRIKKGSEIISNELLKHIPYAISANNGVPTGSIMPFIGTTAPTGWAMCNGDYLPSTATALIALIGNKTPDLRGMFLRGAGDDNRASTVTVLLKGTQLDATEKHAHGKGSLIVSNNGNHNHNNGDYKYLLKRNGIDTAEGFDNTDDLNIEPNIKNAYKMLDAGSHNHTVSGRTADEGTIGETRPINYGVNYIIKL